MGLDKNISLMSLIPIGKDYKGVKDIIDKDSRNITIMVIKNYDLVKSILII